MKTAPTNASFYADPQALASLKRDAKAEAPSALREAAKQFESLFTRMLLKSMRETSMGDSLFSSEETQFYQDMFDDQMAVHLSQGKGMGLADMLVRQLQQAQPAAASSSDLQPTAYSLQPRLEAGGSRLEVDKSSSAAKRSFLSSLLPHAERAARELGVDPHALLAQAALETGWGKSMPAKSDGSPSFNLFGIKAGSSWNGESVGVRTLEFESGVAVAKQERFRSYGSAAESFSDYAALIGRSPRYTGARNTGSDVQAFAQALQSGGYATDPNYARKLSAVAAEVRSLAAERTDANGLKFTSAEPLTSSEGVRG
jgi:peptidoglycan hydrolase FlgJ